MTITLTAKDISKSFGNRKVIDCLSMSVESGHCLAVTGPNGSGKTTLMKMLAGLLSPNDGKIVISDNSTVVKPEHRINYIRLVSPEMALYETLSGYENLYFFATLSGIKTSKSDQDHLLAQVGLEGRGGDRVGAYSSGMRQRLKYAVALLSEPDILLLDEPNTNLDEEGRETTARIMKRQAADRILIIATNEPGELVDADEVIKLDG